MSETRLFYPGEIKSKVIFYLNGKPFTKPVTSVEMSPNPGEEVLGKISYLAVFDSADNWGYPEILPYDDNKWLERNEYNLAAVDTGQETIPPVEPATWAVYGKVRWELA